VKTQHALVLLTLANLALLVFLLAQAAAPAFAQDELQVLRGSALEIVDAQGRVRASITVNPPTVVDGQSYPESVLLRMLGDPRGGPSVKLDVSSAKSALRLADGSEIGAVELRSARAEHVVRIIDGQGEEQRLGR
jgi:hypothetical protein